jgi:hypothetical protein
MAHRPKTPAFICHHRSIGIVRPWKAGGLPRTDRLTQRPRQNNLSRPPKVLICPCFFVSPCPATSIVLAGASVSAKAPVRSTFRRCHHGQTIHQPTSRATLHSALPYHWFPRVVTPLSAVSFAIPLPRPQRSAHALWGSIASSFSSVVWMPRTPASA